MKNNDLNRTLVRHKIMMLIVSTVSLITIGICVYRLEKNTNKKTADPTAVTHNINK